MDKKILGYFLVAGVIVFGGIYLYSKNKSKVIVGGTDTIHINDATKAGMPYALDLTKIAPTQNKISATEFGIVYNVGQWSNNVLRKNSDGYYLITNAVPCGTAFIYDLNTGAFLKEMADPNCHPFQPQQVNVFQDVNTAILAGMPASLDLSKVTLNSSSMFYTLPDGTKLSINHIGDDGSYWIYKDTNQYSYNAKTGAFVIGYTFIKQNAQDPLPLSPNGDPNVYPNGMPIDYYTSDLNGGA